MSPFLRSADDDPVRPRLEAPIRVVVDGVPVEALPGQTVAAALLAAGRDSWRRTRAGGRPRGVFCGIGACFDCLVTVDGIPDVRACQRVLTDGDAITSQSGVTLPRPSERAGDGRSPLLRGGFGPIDDKSRGRVDDELRGRVDDKSRGRVDDRLKGGAGGVDVVVVGAGPAGMGAALAAADAGVEVLLVDAAPGIGGQFHRQLPEEFHAERPESVQHEWRRFADLRRRIEQHERISHLAETSVWAIEPVAGTDGMRASGAEVHRLRLQTGPADAPGRRMSTVDTRALVLATGAYDRVLPFPGWELPGVYAAGAAQALAKGQRIAVGKRVLVAGTGPFLLPVAESLVGVGAEVVGLLEANRPAGVVRGWLTDLSVATGKIREAAGYAALLAERRIPLRYGRAVIAAHGTDRVDAVTVARLDRDWQPLPGSERRIEVDAVCLGFGFTAQLELAVSARCELGIGPDGGPAVVVDTHQRTTAPGVFAAGELTGIGGADLAAAEGRVAGAAAASAAHQLSHEAIDPADRRAIAKGKRFAQALAKAYPIKPGWQSWSTGTTLVCRCEEVSRDDVRDAVADRDVLGTRSLRLSTRAGLGLCQGRICSRTVAELAAAYRPAIRADHAAGARRPIVVPVRLRDLAETPEPADSEEDL
ncbi:MAG TPA: 2Fe-2S iron-sulfur cluster-binding protein [Kribbella sp.]|nr:2Fe-2S iron-sulfur cluster-binding protein [Kribbella sp.]